MSEKKLKNFGVLHLKDLSNLNNVEMRVFSLISKKCSKEVCECKKDPLRSPKFHRIDVKEFVESCGLKRSQIFEGISSLIEKEFILKVKVGRKSLFFPVIEKMRGRFGMTQEVEMVKLTKNETKVYTYLSSLQGDKEESEIPVSMGKIMEMCNMKSLQMVKRTTANLVKKGVVKRVSNYKSASVYHVMRHDETAIFSPKNVPTFSPKNVPNSQDLSPKNVPPLNNSLKDINNLVCNNPASGDIHTNFFEGILKEGKEKSGIDNIPNLGKKEVLRHVVLGTENIHEHNISLGYTPAKNYVSLENKVKDLDDVRLKKIIDTFSPAEMDHLKMEGVSEFEFARVKFSIEAKNPGITVRPLQVKKINKSEIKSLQDFADKYIDSGDRELKYMSGDALDFIAFGFTVSLKKRRLLDILLGDIEKMNNVIHFDFNSKKGSIAEKDGKKVW